ncbi:PAS domain-containing sensor histidine kinase [Methylobacterium phyllostachyos]|nr:PAS domain-containing sensor histidine kinase [Methylobacterium phyllostachyos]
MVFAVPDPVYLVLDTGAGTILHASPAARPLSDMLSGPGLRDLLRQVASATPQDGTPRLARLRLDPRRIAPPVLCWLARGNRDGGTPVILVMPATPVATPKARPCPQEAPAAPPPAPPVERDDRFLWRIDASGELTLLTGPESLAGLVGQRWQDLTAAGRIAGAEGVLAALHERRTFRGEPAVLDAGTGPFRVELSGAPLGRGDAAYAGFAGFGLIRALPPGPTVRVTEASSVVAVPPSSAEIPEPLPPAPMPAEPDPPGSVEPAPPATPLSTDEHAAFREIARALGARYAGDDAEPAGQGTKSEGGAIMPFPGPQPGLPETHDDSGAAASVPEILAGLPLPALVHRAGSILAANAKLLALTGHADVAALSGRGLGGLFPGAAHEGDTDPAARVTAIVTTDGCTRPVEVLSNRCSWTGEPAICLLLRPIDEADAAAELAAERLARANQSERAVGAEAALDALDSGIVTLDHAGRIVAVNRAAATLLGCEAREIVGGSFVSQFDRESVLTVADLLRGVTRGPRSVSLAGTPVTLDVRVAQEDSRLVAILDGAKSRSSFAAAGMTDRAASSGASNTLARLDRAFREPLTGMIGLVDAMLKEPFGPLGDARYNACIAEIKASGGTMLERVGNLLDLAAVEFGALHLEPRAFDLNDLAAGCVARFQAEAARGRVVVRTSFSTDLGELEADERSVSRAAGLVIENAIRRSAAGGQIIVSTGAAERAGVALRVRDTGAAGRSADPRREVEEGLALPRALVEANGGRLELSTPAEDGTLVEIIMPVRRMANG